MRDPVDELSGFDPGPPMPALPAPEVRRLGDRRRRRQNLLSGIGAAVAVAVIAVPVAVVAGGGEGDDVQPAPAPSPSVTTTGGPRGTLPTIPDSVDLTAGMPENESGEPVVASREADGLGTAGLAFCGRAALAARGFSDRLAANARGPEGTGAARDLRAYVTDAEAADALAGLVARVRACPSEGVAGATWLHEVSPADLGEESVRVTRTYLQGGVPVPAATWWQVVRVGNALLVHMAGGEIAPGPSLEGAIAADTEALAPLVGSLCVFSAEGCGGPVLGPNGYGDLEIGMSVDEALATGDAVLDEERSAPGCQALVTAGDLPAGGSVVASADGGIELISPAPGALTPEGIGVGSDLDDVREAYADAEERPNRLSAPSDQGARYELVLDQDGVVTELALVSDERRCAS